MSRPCCPSDHPGVEMSPTDNPRIWICVVSKCQFEVEVDVQSTEARKDKFGNTKLVYKITPIGEGEQPSTPPATIFFSISDISRYYGNISDITGA